MSALLILLLGAAACGDDADDAGSSGTTITTADPADVEGSTSSTVAAAAAELPDDVCALVGDAAASEATGLELVGATPDGNELRRVCTYSPQDNEGIGITVGVQSGSRFDDKAATSERALGPGEPVEGLGDRALSFYDDEDIPEGIGGTLVAVGDLTVDVSVQGLADEGATRDAGDALAALVVDGL